MLASKVDESLRFMKAIGVDTESATFKQAQFYTAHECLLLPYENALTRLDSTTGRCVCMYVSRVCMSVCMSLCMSLCMYGWPLRRLYITNTFLKYCVI